MVMRIENESDIKEKIVQPFLEPACSTNVCTYVNGNGILVCICCVYRSVIDSLVVEVTRNCSTNWLHFKGISCWLQATLPNLASKKLHLVN